MMNRPNPSEIRRWSDEEIRLLLAMRREGIQRKVIARILSRSPKSVKVKLETGMRYRPLGERFWEKVDRQGSADCWPWKAFVTPKGYGMISVGRRMQHAHRVSFELNCGHQIPAGLVVCHKCDNPTCVNPRHLFLGTQLDNIADMKAKGRAKGPYRPGEACPTSKLTEAQVREIRKRVAAGESQRSLRFEYGVSQPTISDLVNGRTWGHVQ